MKGKSKNAGEKHGNSKLVEWEVKWILHLYATGQHSQRKLGRCFGVGKSTIGFITRDESWRHLKKERT